MFGVFLALKFPVHVVSSVEILTHSVKLVPTQNLIFYLKRSIHKAGGNDHHTEKSSFKSSSTIPRLIYVQNPLSWFRNKIYLKILKYSWDRQFDESDFKRGAKQVEFLTVSLLVTISNNRTIQTFQMFL